MPPKGWRKTSEGFKPVNSSGTPLKEKENFKLDDLLLPKATIHKLAGEALPQGTTVPAEGLLALRRSSAVFINHLSSEANLIAQASGRKTIQPADVLKALENVDLAQFLPSVKSQLEEYESYVTARKEAKKNELKEHDHLISDDEDKAEPHSAVPLGNEPKRQKKGKDKDDDAAEEDNNGADDDKPTEDAYEKEQQKDDDGK